MQTDSMPFAEFGQKLNEVQENVFTVTTERFSRFLINVGDLTEKERMDLDIMDVKRRLVESGFATDQAGNLVVEIDPREVMPNHTSATRVRDWCRQLSGFHVRFKVGNWNGRKNMEAYQTLFVGVLSPEDIENADDRHVFLSLNNWAIPFFLYYGAFDIYFGKVQKEIAIGLKGQTEKRLYKMICSMYGKKGNRCEMSLDSLRRMLNLSGEIRMKTFSGGDSPYYVTKKNTYLRTDKMRKVLDQAQKAISESGSDCWFEYELVSRGTDAERTGRPRLDTVIFIVHNRNASREAVAAPHDEEAYERLVHLFQLYAMYDIVPMMCVLESAQAVLDAGAADVVLKKHDYYKEKLVSKDPYEAGSKEVYRKQLKHEFNIIHKILKEDYSVILHIV